MFLQFGAAILVVGFFYFFQTFRNLTRKMFQNICKDGLIEFFFWIYRLFVIFFHQRRTSNRMNDFNRNDNSFKLCGIIPTPGDIHMEANKLLTDKCHSDSMFIWAGDKSGKFVAAKITYLENGQAYVYMFVRDESGRTFSMPKNVHIFGKPLSNTWKVGGLLLECLEPMRSWRLKFNGPLVSDNSFEQKVINCRMDFIWRAFKKPIDIWKETSSQLLADSIKSHDLVNFLNGSYVDGYDQWGALHGTITFDEKQMENWYLRGQRQHRFSNSSSISVTECLSVRHYSSNGDMFYVEKCVGGSPINTYTLGYLLTSSGLHHSITDVLVQSDIVESEKVLFVKFSANGKNKEEKIIMKNEIISISEETNDKMYFQANERSWSVIHVEKGFDLVQQNSKQSNVHIEIPEVSGMPYVISLEHEDCKVSSISGGKGSSLACLMTLVLYSRQRDVKFDVPKGFVVTTKSWNGQLEKDPIIAEEITSLQDIMTDGNTRLDHIKGKCDRLVSLIEDVEIYAKVADQVFLYMESVFPHRDPKRRFAVRSSACGEDGLESSSAGQNKTFLGCNVEDGVSSILKAIAACWASQFTYQSVEYRRQRGQALQSDMAVVIQEMVMPSVSGVVFTNDPTTGRADTVVITANYGLGESVVSACVEPDTIYLKRNISGDIQIENVIIGDKREKTILKGDHGIENIYTDKNESSRLCLSDEDALYLTKVANLIEDAFASPKDIEFAFSQGTLFILQARPITTLESWTDYEIIHEADKAVLTERELFTIANSGEVFPGYMDTLTLSLVPKLLDLSIQRDFCMREWPFYEYDPSVLRTLATFSHRCMGDMGEMMYRGMDENISAVNNAVDLSVFGRLVTSPDIHSWAKDRYGVMGTFVKFIRLGYGFYDFMFNNSRINTSKKNYDYYSIQKEHAKSIETARQKERNADKAGKIKEIPAQKYYDVICDKLPEIMMLCENHCHTSCASTMSQCIALIVLSEGSDEITPEMVQNIAALFGSISDTESGDVPTALEELSDAICDSGKSAEFLSLSPEDGSHWLTNQSSTTVANKFKKFITNHGHRCIKEFYFTSPSWGMNPASLMPSLKQMVKNGRSTRVKAPKQSIEEVMQTLSGDLKNSTKRALKFIIGLCGTTVRQRETTKSMTIRSLDNFKQAYKHLADLMVKEFRLPDRDLIYYLTHNEIGILLRTRSANLVTKAIRRRKLMKSVESLDFPEISVGVPVPINLHEVENGVDYGTTAQYGTPVCFGSLKGIARVVCNLEEADLIQPGEILITKCTDVGWTPYFPLLGGIVTEIGGLISHGAVIAREYGLPCVVGVKHATNIFHSGELVFIDGKEGSIRKIQDEMLE